MFCTGFITKMHIFSAFNNNLSTGSIAQVSTTYDECHPVSMHKLDQYLSGSLLAFKKIDVFKAGSSAKQSRI